MIRPASQLSFLPDDYLERKSQRRANVICGVLFVAVMAGVGSAFSLSEQATRRVEREYDRLEAQYLGEARRLEQVRQMQEKQKRMAHQAELTASLLERVPRSYLLAEVTNSMPAGVSLLEFSMDSKPRAGPAPAEAAKTAYELKKAARQGAAKTPAGPPPPEIRQVDVHIRMTGIAQTDVQVAQFLNRLSRSRLMKDVNLVFTEELKQQEDRLRKFQMEMMLDPRAEVVNPVDAGSPTAAVELKEAGR